MIKNAKDATELSKKNCITINEILDCVESSAEQGQNYCFILKTMPVNIHLELMKLGFTLSIVKDNIGNENSKISW